MRRILRTSETDPLRIAEVSAGKRGGMVGITFCPGKCGDSFHGAGWQRDLGIDLDAIRNWGAQTVVTLVEEHELELLQVRELGAQVLARGMRWHHLPIEDVQPPGPVFEQEWRQVGPELVEGLKQGGRVLVHCRGGLGRAGTVAALLLVATGEAPQTAIDRVRAARPGAIETRAQEAYVQAWRPAVAEGHTGSQVSVEVSGHVEGPTFWFEEIDSFDARGLRPCRIPGCGLGARYGTIRAYFWRDRHDQVLIRFTWARWRYHFRVVLAGGEQLPDAVLDDLLACVEGIQDEWAVDAPDLPPEVPMKPDREDDDDLVSSSV